MTEFLALLMLIIFSQGCGEDVRGSRVLIQNAEEDSDTIKVRCFTDPQGAELRYVISSINGRFDYVSCLEAESSCQAERIVLTPGSEGEGNQTRPCLSDISQESTFKICISGINPPPDNSRLITMEGQAAEITFTFYCDEHINIILR